MSRPRVLPLAVAIAAAAVFAVSCSEPVTPPPPPPAAPQNSLLGGLLGATGLLSCNALPYDSVTQTVGPNGGIIQVGPHYLAVPYGALSSPVSITAVIPSGSRINQVRFKPEGLQFQRSAALTMSYANCNLLGKLLPKRIAYIDANQNILEYLLSLDLLNLRNVTGQLRHFSAYAVAW